MFSHNPKHYTNIEIKSFFIFRKLINHPDSTFLMAPLSNERYVKNEKLGVFLWISYMRLKITNQTYSYDIRVNEGLSNKIQIIFDKKLEMIREEFQNEMENNFQNSLTKIFS